MEIKAISVGAQVLNLNKLLKQENENFWSEKNKIKEILVLSEKYRLKTVEQDYQKNIIVENYESQLK